MIMIVIMIVIMIMIVIVIMIMSIHDYGYGYDYDYDKVNDKVKSIRIVIIVITFLSIILCTAPLQIRGRLHELTRLARFAGIRFSPDLHGASQALTTRELALALSSCWLG